MKLFKLLIILLILIFGYLMLVSYPYFFSKINRFNSLGLLSLVEEKSVSVKKTFSAQQRTDQFDNHFLKGEKITSKIKASENNFGILLFRFAKLSEIVSDTVTFRIKEEGKNWYYEKSYKADQFQPDQYFTFGFPPIVNSKNTIYLFEIESLAGTGKNGIGLSQNRPQVALVYKYSRDDLKNFEKFLPFASKKFIYVIRNVNLLQNLHALITISLLLFFILMLLKKKARITNIVTCLQAVINGPNQSVKKVNSELKFGKHSYEKKIIKTIKNLKNWFVKTHFYKRLLDTNKKKRLAIALSIFIIALLYRFSRADNLGVSSFFSVLGNGGDYDQFIIAATCAVRNFCPAILGQNFLFESSILGKFYEMFGFVGGLKAYLYLMIILSSIVACLPYLLMSRKNFFTIGGIIGSLYLSTSEFLTSVSISLPPDNGSLFTFSIFFLVYLMAIHTGTIRWLMLFGLMATLDGLNKFMLITNALAVLILFIPMFFYEKVKKIKKFPYLRFEPTLMFYSFLPLLIFLIINLTWEYIIQNRFGVHYYLGRMFESGFTYISRGDVASDSVGIFSKSILEILLYFSNLTIDMVKRLIENSGLNDLFLTPILVGLLLTTFRKSKYLVPKLITIIVFAILILIFVLIKINFLGIQDVGQYVNEWGSNIYINIFMFLSIVLLFILNFKYQAFKLALPIIPYIAILILISKNAPVARLLVHAIVWSIILLSFLIDWILSNVKKDYALKKLWIGPILLTLFIYFYIIPKTSSMAVQLYSGIINSRNEIKYLKWVSSELPENAIVLAGGESDLISLRENIQKPIVYSALWTGALLIKPNEIPGFAPSDWHIVNELQNKKNFTKYKYLILEDDIYLWRGRVNGVGDNLFSTSSAALLHGNEYSLKLYEFNSDLNRGIYELTFIRN